MDKKYKKYKINKWPSGGKSKFTSMLIVIFRKLETYLKGLKEKMKN